MKAYSIIRALFLTLCVVFVLGFLTLWAWLRYPTAERQARAATIQQTGRMIHANALQGIAGRPKFSQVVSIGDSFSDTGRLKSRTKGMLVPDFAFFEGRCSNGPLWIEYVKEALGVDLLNLAYGGATTSPARLGIFNLIFLNFQEQVDEYFAAHPGPIDARDKLITVTGGGNNLFIEELRDFAVMKRDIGQVFRKFHSAGARHFLFLGIGNWHPPANPLDRRVAGRESEVYAFLGRYHQEMRGLIQDLESELTGIEIEYIDTDEIDQNSQKQPSEWGFQDVETSCFKGDIIGRLYAKPGVCASPHTTKFWEHFHLSSKMHCHIAVQVLRQMSLKGWVDGFDPVTAHNVCRNLGISSEEAGLNPVLKPTDK